MDVLSVEYTMHSPQTILRLLLRLFYYHRKPEVPPLSET